MAFVIWYQLVFKQAGLPGFPPLRVSNDIFSGQYILDADITVIMKEGAAADTFDIRLVNLPADVAETLARKQAERLNKPDPFQVEIRLGYFDEPATKTGAQPVMVGAVTSMNSTVSDDGKLVTTLKGQEIGGYRLRIVRVEQGRKGSTDVGQFVNAVAKAAGVDPPGPSGLNQTLDDFTLVAGNGLDALRQLAARVRSPLVVRDNKILMGAQVGRDKAPVPLDPETNLVKLEQAQANEETAGPAARAKQGKVESKPRSTLDATMLGHPGLRVGQSVKLVNGAALDGPLRIAGLNHHYSTRLDNAGYTCQATLVAAGPGELATVARGVQGVVDRIQDLAEDTAGQRTSIDIGQVKDYQPGGRQKHLATLDYGQYPPAGAVAPSVEVAVETATQLHNKPFASPFAWHKCGLTVPVYPGMRALLAHNRGLVNDAVIVGFLWPENPRAEPPQNEEGDYWLCLPTEISNNQPTGKGVNDLTDKSGRRVIQTKALHILVATSKLPDVGVRPPVPAEGTITIEHESGTTIKVADDGAITVTTNQKDIALGNGSVTLKLSGAALEVS